MEVVTSETQARSEALFQRIRLQQSALRCSTIPFPIAIFKAMATTLSEEGRTDLKNEDCPVCLDDMAAGDEVLTLGCGHTFHWACLVPWLEMQGRDAPCPKCKAKICKLHATDMLCRPAASNSRGSTPLLPPSLSLATSSSSTSDARGVGAAGGGSGGVEDEASGVQGRDGTTAGSSHGGGAAGRNMGAREDLWDEDSRQEGRMMIGGRPADAVRMRAATAGMVRRLQAAAVARRGRGLGASLVAKRAGAAQGGWREGGQARGGGGVGEGGEAVPRQLIDQTHQSPRRHD